MTSRFAVMGNPISHSLSPLIHQRFASQCNVSLLYERIQVSPERFATQVNTFFSQGGRGLNITLPFKTEAFSMALQVTPRAAQAKAANTLWVEDGQLQADNTDGIGLLKDLQRHINLTDKKILVVGAGGAARGILGPLMDSNLKKLTLVNRTYEKAIALQADFPKIEICPFPALDEPFDLIINATSARFTTDPLPLPNVIIQPATLCYDLSYDRDHITPFVHWAQDQGVEGVDGLGMLVEQAAEAFYIWHGLKPQTMPVLEELRSKKFFNLRG